MSQFQTTDKVTFLIRGLTVERRNLAGIFLFALAAQFMTVIMLAAAMVPDYDFGSAAMSDLGVFPETAVLFNVSLILVGVLNLLGGYFFYLQAIGSATRFSGIMRGISVLAGAIGIVFVVLMAIGNAGNAAAFGPIGHGGTERMTIYPVMLWLVAVGGYLLGSEPAEPADYERPDPA